MNITHRVVASVYLTPLYLDRPGAPPAALAQRAEGAAPRGRHIGEAGSEVYYRSILPSNASSDQALSPREDNL